MYDGTSDVIVISYIRSRRSTSLLLTQSSLLSKYVLGAYKFTNIVNMYLRYACVYSVRSSMAARCLVFPDLLKRPMYD